MGRSCRGVRGMFGHNVVLSVNPSHNASKYLNIVKDEELLSQHSIQRKYSAQDRELF